MEYGCDHPTGNAAPALDTSQPFRSRDAKAAGVTTHVLARLVREGSLRRVLQGVYVDNAVPDTIELRARALGLVVCQPAVITDRTAAWLRGVSVLAAGEHLSDPPISIVRLPGNTRVRVQVAAGGVRMLSKGDIEVLHGLHVTTALRTALDLGRLTPPDSAISALDALMRTSGFTHADLLGQLPRFRGFRGVRQLRRLAPLADPRAESPGESWLRLRWIESGLPAPELQVPFSDDNGMVRFRGDIGSTALRLLAEYDGEAFHSTAAQRRHDAQRRQWITAQGWTVVVVRKEHLFGSRPAVYDMLRRGLAAARSDSAAA